MPSKKKNSKHFKNRDKTVIGGMDLSLLPEPPKPIRTVSFGFQEKQYLFLVSKNDIMSQLLFNPIILLICLVFLTLTWNNLTKDVAFVAGMVVGMIVMLLFMFGTMLYRGEKSNE